MFEGVASEVGPILSQRPGIPIRERVWSFYVRDPPKKDLPQAWGQVPVGPDSVPVSVDKESDTRRTEARVRTLAGQPDCKVAPNHLR